MANMDDSPEIVFLTHMVGFCRMARQRGDLHVARLAIDQEERLLALIEELRAAAQPHPEDAGREAAVPA
jgi:hypothetical protein